MSSTEASPPLALALVGQDSSVHLEPISDAELDEPAPSVRTTGDVEAAILTMLDDAIQPLRRDELRARLRVRNATLGKTLTRLVEQGRIVRHDSGWAAVQLDSPSPDSPASQ